MRTSIPFAEVKAFIESLGVDSNDVATVELNPDAVVVVQLRRDEDGRRFVAGNHAATVTTEIRIERDA